MTSKILSELDNDFIVILGIQIMKGILFITSGVWILSRSYPSSPYFVISIFVWGVVELMSSFFALIPTRNARIGLTVIIIFPGISLLLNTFVGILSLALSYPLFGMSFYPATVILAIPLIAFIGSIFNWLIMTLVIIEVLLIVHYFMPNSSSW